MIERKRTGIRRILLASVVCAAVNPQTTPTYFELILPDLNKVIGSGNVVADIPANHVSRINIQLLGSADRNLGYSDVHVRINGKGVGNIFDSGANERGKFLAMDPSTAARRHDAIFDSRENTVEVYGRDARGRGYYQNWILRSGADHTNAFFSYVSALSPSDETGVAPDLNIDTPTLPITFPNGSRSVTVRIKGSAGASSGIATLNINNKPIPNIGRSLSFSFEESVEIARGENSVVIEAIDKKENRRSVTIPVLYPATGPQKLRVSGERFAVLIGISRFGSASEGFLPITAAAADARLLADTLQEHGFRNENIRLLADEQATTEQLRSAFGDFTARAKPQDLLVVFVATHGVHDPLAPERVYLAGAETQRKALRETAIEISELQLLLNRALRSRHALLFFDVEHPLGPEWSFPGKPVIDSHLLSLFNGSAAPSVLVSTSAGQESQQRQDAGTSRGIFAAALGKAFSGSADVNHDGVLTPRELCAYVSEAVRNTSGGQQSPQYRFADTEADTPVLSLGH
jgi:hypothetical protein